MPRKIIGSTIKTLPIKQKKYDIIENLYIKAKIKKAIKDVENDKVISHDDLKKELKE